MIDQGTVLDSVEYNVEQTALFVKDAETELGVAVGFVAFSFLYELIDIFFWKNRYQRNTTRRQCIFLLVLIILGLIVVLIFKPRRNSTPSSSIDTPI